ncbi:MAG: site-specific integrase [Candidatus Saccharibacteria bacterium]|nr:site-specific integrase [Candidatus Saccharibacteria bacterium]
MNPRQSPALSTRQVNQKKIIQGILLQDILTDIQATYKDNQDYQYTLMSFIKFVCDDREFYCYFGLSTIQDYKTWLTTVKKYKPATIKKYLIVAKDYCQAMYKRKDEVNQPVKITEDITLNSRGKPIKIPKVNTQLKQGFKNYELKKIKQAYPTLTDLRLKALLSLLYFGAYRIGECQSLMWSDIDFNKKTISVVGKGNIANTKAMHSEIEKALGELQGQLKLKGAIFKTAGKQANTKTLRRWIQRFLADLDIKGHNPHSFRHTSIMECVRAGFTLEQLKYHSRHQGLAGLQAYISSVQAENSHELIEQALTSVSKE